MLDKATYPSYYLILQGERIKLTISKKKNPKELSFLIL